MIRRGPRRRAGLRRERHDIAAAAAWWDAVVKDAKGRPRPCFVCRSRAWIEAHHLVPQQELKRIAHTADVPAADLLWDRRNGIPLCKRCHARHTSAMVRVPRAALPAAAWEFARELDERLFAPAAPVTARLEREYPEPPKKEAPDGGQQR